MDDGQSVAQDQSARALSGLSDERREMFALRLDRWWPDLCSSRAWWAIPGTPTGSRHPAGLMVGLYNVTDSRRPWSAARVAELGHGHPFDAISSRFVEPDADGNLWLPPYAGWWLVDRD